MNTTTSGNVTLIKVIDKLSDLGYVVSVPLGEGYSYDLIADDGQKLYRVQCKTARIAEGCVEFNCYTVTKDRKNKKYDGEVDLFAAYCPSNGKVYLVPIEVASGIRCRMRLAPSKFAREAKLAQTFAL